MYTFRSLPIFYGLYFYSILIIFSIRKMGRFRDFLSRYRYLFIHLENRNISGFHPISLLHNPASC